MDESTEEARQDARKTHLYLRIGIMGALVLLTISIALEATKVDCIQTSISAYYYTPVRAIFVGVLFAIGLALIVYKGRGPIEDAALNVAGMLAPLVAVAPTTDVGKCWSVVPNPLPVEPDGSLANWVVTNIENNFTALLVAGAAGFIVAVALAIVTASLANRTVQETVRSTIDFATRVSLAVTAVVLVVAGLLSEYWSDFNTQAHGWAAVLLFASLILAIAARAFSHRRQNERVWTVYAGVAMAMVLGAAVIVLTRMFEEHTVFYLEAWEIALFASYWIAQTVRTWRESVEVIRPPLASGARRD